ncbi:MAG TPA: DUF3501 family protein [Holophagaceae bacterium]|nr:DUF3501 family protein [Holophagaceae bacterium]
MDATLPFFDPAAEAARFQARAAFLARQAALRIELAPGISFQPETAESVADQVAETLRAEGKDPATADPAELAEVQASFAVLAPRREPGHTSVAATLMLAIPEAEREARLEALRGFPESLLLELEDGRQISPDVDRGSAGPEDRLPSVLALRYRIPKGGVPRLLHSDQPVLSGRWKMHLPMPWA